VITGGTQAGDNLFHSFREFSVPTGNRASFQQLDADIANIFSRITGTSVSNIDGAIEALQADRSLSSANLFLINPNGIIFGANASLNLGGSFIATSANSIRFADGTEFSAVDSQASPLLTVSVPIGLQFGGNPGAIIVRSAVPLVDNTGNPIIDIVDPVFNPEGQPAAGLRVQPGQTLALLGGDVVISGGVLTAAGGRIELGSITSPTQVDLLQPGPAWQLRYSPMQNNNAQAFGTIQLTNQAFVNASSEGGGTIQVQGNRVVINSESELFSNTLGDRNGGDVIIRAAQLQVDEFALVGTNTFGSGSGGNTRITVDRLRVSNGGQVRANTTGPGQAGNLVVNAAESIELSGINSGLFVRVGRQAATDVTGQGGNLTLSTQRLAISAGAQIASDTFAAGNAGTIRIRSNVIDLNNIARDRNGNPLLVPGFGVPVSPSAISAFAFPSASGNAGNIDITTQRLRLRDGAVIQTTATSTGDAGNLQITAESIELSGAADGGREAPTGLLAFSGGIPGTLYEDIGIPTATGRGGNVILITEDLIVRDRAVIAVGSLNADENAAAGAGRLRIQADAIQLNNQGNLLAATASGDGGNIALQVQEVLSLRNNSNISATAGTAEAGGNGGNITINADFIVSAPSENSDITANAFTGTGGNITITAQGVIGIEPRSQTTHLSDITASSELGLPGTIQINTPDVDPSQGLVELPTDVVDAAGLIAQTCSTSETIAETSISEFVITGRGGLPPSPGDRRSSDAIQTNWVTLPDEVVQEVEPTTVSALATPIVEAQGWVVGETGEVRLVAHAPTDNASNARRLPGCLE
jgi:filamentous hemagglutinin family protein